MRVSQHKGVIGQAFSAQGRVRMNGENRIQCDIYERAGVVSDAIRITALHRQGGVDETHGTVGGRGGEGRGESL